jgi:Fe2+ or Zn2+ uptake regulation protein
LVSPDGFKVAHYDILFHGLCAACAQANPDRVNS